MPASAFSRADREVSLRQLSKHGREVKCPTFPPPSGLLSAPSGICLTDIVGAIIDLVDRCESMRVVAQRVPHTG